MASKVGEKGVALKVDEKSASHLTPLHAPAIHTVYVCLANCRGMHVHIYGSNSVWGKGVGQKKNK